MHTAYCSPALPGPGNASGIVTYVGLMRDAMRALGHKVTVVTDDAIERSTGEVVSVRKSRFSDPIVKLLTGALSDGAEIIEIEESFGFASRIVGKGIPVVMRLHGPHCYGREAYETADEKKASDKRAADELRAISKVSAVTCPSQALWEALWEDYAISPRVGRVIPNPMPVPEAQWMGGDPDQVLFVGRFDHRKGADVALEAFSKAREQRLSLRMVMVGEDRGVRKPDGTVHFSPCEGVTFLGLQPAERIAELRKQSGLALCASRFETFSYAVAESLAFGMPVISSRCFGPPETILDRGGILVPVGDADATARAILNVASNPETSASMGREGRKNVARWLDPEIIARQTLDVYEAALLSRGVEPVEVGRNSGRNVAVPGIGSERHDGSRNVEAGW